MKLAALLRQRGRFPEAEQHLGAVIATREREKGADDRSVGFALVELGGLQRVMGRFAEAEATYLRVIANLRRHEGDDAVNVGITLDNLAYVYNELGRRADAERLHRQALGIFEAKLGSDHVTTATGLSNLATLYYVQGRDAEARPLYERALAIYRKRVTHNDPRIGVLLDQYAGLERRAGRYLQARTLYARALAILSAAHGPGHPEAAKAMNNMALAEQALGNLAEAERLMRAAIAAQEKAFGADHYLVGAGYSNLGDVLLARGQLEPAIATLTRAIAIIEAAVGTEHPMLLAPLRQLAGTYVALSRWDAALAHSRRAVKVALADARRGRHDLENARDTSQVAGAFNGALFVAWRAAEAEPQRTDALAAEAFETAQWLTQSQAGRTLAQIGARLAARDTGIGELVRRRQDLGKSWARANERLVALVSKPGAAADAGEVARLRAELARFENEIAARDGELAQRFPEFQRLADPEPLGFAAVQSALGADEALVQYVSLGDASYAWVATRERLVWRRIAMPTRDITKLVAKLRCGLDSGEWVGEAKSLKCLDLVGQAPDDRGLMPFDARAAGELYDALIRPIEGDIAKRRLLIVPSGALTRLPFQVLVVAQPAAGRSPFEVKGLDWLVLHRSTSMLPSVASLAVLRARSAASKARQAYFAVSNPLLTGADGTDRRAFEVTSCRGVGKPVLVAANTGSGASSIVVRGGVADVASVRQLAPLPETTTEVCRVASRLGAPQKNVLIGADAREATIRKLSDEGRLGDYRLLHFATHGLVSGELKGLAEPALVLTPPDEASAADDGLLLASEVAALRLDADWVVLSACNTGAGDGESTEALSGLANAFFHAGARSLLVSHWPVQSDAAVSLVTHAVAELEKGTGRAPSKGEALRRAMVQLLAAARTEADAHPQTWAPFVVIGETGGNVAARVSRRPPPGVPVGPKSAGGPGSHWVGDAFGAR